MKILYEDTTPIFNTEDDTEDTSSNIYVDHGTFYRADENGQLIELPQSIQDKLTVKYHRWQRAQLMKEKGLDPEKLKQQNKERLAQAGKSSVDDLKAQEANWKKAQMYKAQAETAAQRKYNQEKAKTAVKKFSSAKELAQELGLEVKDFMKNQLKKIPQRRVIKSYENPDPYETVDPRIFTQGDTDIYELPKDDPKNESRPLVLFYFDRSYSFNERDASKRELPSIQKKVQLGRDIQAMFDTYADQVDTKTIYFSGNVFEDETAALDRGGNNGTRLMDDIAARTKGRLANVVILTDSDNGSNLPVVPINGSVWLVFAEVYDEGALAAHFRKLTPKTKISEYFYR